MYGWVIMWCGKCDVVVAYLLWLITIKWGSGMFRFRVEENVEKNVLGSSEDNDFCNIC